MQNRAFRSLAMLGLLTLAASAHAETIYGLAGYRKGDYLVSFDSLTPRNLTTYVPITGMVGDQVIRAIDFRPATGQLYAVSNMYSTGQGPAAQLYTVNRDTGTLTPVGSGFNFPGSPNYSLSMDFDPVADELRVVSGDGHNIRLNPNTGAVVATDTNIAYDASVDAGGSVPFIKDIAYSNNTPGATQATLFAWGSDAILTLGSPNGTPISPNSGLLFNSLSTSGIGFYSYPIDHGFDISSTTGIAYLSAKDFGTNYLYTVNLTNGVAYQIGYEASELLDIAVFAPTPVPEPGTIAFLVGLGISGVALRRRKK